VTFGEQRNRNIIRFGTMCKVFISYSQDSFEHKSAVKGLANQLRAAQIECDLDQDEEFPEEGWPTWMMRKIRGSRFVLVVCSEGYWAKFHHESPSGKGVKWEGSIITQELYEAEARNQKFIPVLFSEADARFIPIPLRPYTYYVVTQVNDYEALVNRLSGRATGSRPRHNHSRLKASTGHRPDSSISSPAGPGNVQFNSGDGNVQVGNLSGSLSIQATQRPVIKFSLPRGTIGDNDLLKNRISELFNKVGEEREKRFGKTAYSVMYRNFKRDFGIESQPWTIIWQWPEATAQAIIKYLSEKYANTIAGREGRAGKKGGELPKRPQLYKEEKGLLEQIGIEISSPEVKEALSKYFGVDSHTKLTQYQHWLCVCRLEREVREAVGEQDSEQVDGHGS